ncbi:hypothetical protein KUTeg_013431 [Tegillarca granosa]|uniref:DNA mismatch repair protein Mlh3 n=1 Tax=Tegillarca granosa TaxID=220873 RepID=A0ABQ9ETP3_TEGGR|nr:hypothetical protein KUTeg_013431 [Tegillarca granosa]
MSSSSITQLTPEVKSLLRTGVAITSVTQCIEEMVLNSIDSGASCIAVRVDMSCYKFQVADNGCGISEEQLGLVGQRYSTSKCHTVGDLDNLCYYGYRGEAIASLKDVTSLLEIVSRTKTSARSYCKMFQKGRSLSVIESSVNRPSAGTTVTVHDLFYNLPVRRNVINANLEVENIKKRLEAIALIKPGISVTLRNDVSGNVILQTQKTNSVLNTFTSIFGVGRSKFMSKVEGHKSIFSVTGYIGKEGYCKKDCQFVYINGRLILKTKIHKHINNLLKKSLILKKQKANDSSSQADNSLSLTSSPTKYSEKHGMYVMDIKCPYTQYDITFEPAKTLVEFRDWDTVILCIEEIVQEFLKRENLQLGIEKLSSKTVDEESEVMNGNNENDEAASRSDEHKYPDIHVSTIAETPDEEEQGDDIGDLGKNYGRGISTQNTKNGLFSEPVKRKLQITTTHEGYNDDLDLNGHTDYTNEGNKNEGQGHPSFEESLYTPITLPTERKVPKLIQKPSVESLSSLSESGSFSDNLDGEITDEEPLPSLKQAPHPKHNETHIDKCMIKLRSRDMSCGSSTILRDLRASNNVKSLPTKRKAPVSKLKERLNVFNKRLSEPGVTTRQSTASSSLSRFKQGLDAKKLNDRHSNSKIVQESTDKVVMIDQEVHSCGPHGFTKLQDIAGKTRNLDVEIQQNLYDANSTQQTNVPSIAKTANTEKRPQQISNEIPSENDTALRESFASKLSKRFGKRRKSDDKVSINQNGINDQTEILTVHRGNTERELPNFQIGGRNKKQTKQQREILFDDIRDQSEPLNQPRKETDLVKEICVNFPIDREKEGLTYVSLDREKERSDNDIFVQSLSDFGLETLETEFSSNQRLHSNDFTPAKEKPETVSYTSVKQKPDFSSYNKKSSAIDLGPVKEKLDSLRFTSDIKRKKYPDASDTQTRNFMTTDLLLQTAQSFVEQNCLGDGCNMHESLSGQSRNERFQEKTKYEDHDKSAFEMLTAKKKKKNDEDWNNFDHKKPVKSVIQRETDLTKEFDVHCQDSSVGQKLMVSHNAHLSVDADEGYDIEYCDSETNNLIDSNAVEQVASQKSSGDLDLLCYEKIEDLPLEEYHTKLFEPQHESILSPSQGFSTTCVSSISGSQEFSVYPFHSDQYRSEISREDARQHVSQNPSCVSPVGSEGFSPVMPLTDDDNEENDCKSETERKGSVTSSQNISNIDSPVTKILRSPLHVSELFYMSETGNNTSVTSQNISKINLQDLQVSKDASNVLHSPLHVSDLFDMSVVNDKLENSLGNEFDNSNCNIIKISGWAHDDRNNVVNMETEIQSNFQTADLDCTRKVIEKDLLYTNGIGCEVADDQENSNMDLVVSNNRLKHCESQNLILTSNFQLSGGRKEDFNGIKLDTNLTLVDVETESEDSFHGNKSDGGHLDTNMMQVGIETESEDSFHGNKSNGGHLDTSMTQIDVKTEPEDSFHGNKNDGDQLDMSQIENRETEDNGDESYMAMTQSGEDMMMAVADAAEATFICVDDETESLDTEISAHIESSNMCTKTCVDCEHSKSEINVSNTDDISYFGDDDDLVSVKWKDKLLVLSEEAKTEELGLSVDDLFKKWNNPVFERPDREILNAEVVQSSKCDTATSKVLYPHRFTKEMLKHAKVLGQVDNKFIACLFPSRDQNNDQNLIVMMDQHAVHERVRLEQLTAAAYCKDDNGIEKIVSSAVVPPEPTLLSQDEVRIMTSFKDEFERIGIKFTVDKTERNKIHLETIPACVVLREVNELRRNRDPIAFEIIETMIKEHTEYLRSTGGCRGILPGTLHKVLSTQACRGAIKFGHRLSLSKCEELVQSLNHCKLPFQCAHGRPSIVPILNLDKIPAEPEARKAKIWKISGKLRQMNTI